MVEARYEAIRHLWGVVLRDRHSPRGEEDVILTPRSDAIVHCGRCGNMLRRFHCKHIRIVERILGEPV